MADPFSPSPELAAIATRWLKAYAARNSKTAANLLSSSDALTYIGSDEGELFTGENLRETFEKYSDDQAVLIPENINATAYEAGDFGWAFTTLTIHAPEAELQVAFRNTFIFAMEEGVWRIVHIHNSNPKPNMEAMGYELSRFEDLLDAARAEEIEITQTGIASVMFTDIVDSTALASAVGDARWHRIVTAHIGQITALVQAEGGTLVKSLGDGTLATFSSAAAAMRAAIGIQRTMADQSDEPKLRIRVGIHTGDVIQKDGDFVGTVVNKAARVAGMTEPGNIRVSEATRVMVGDATGFTFTDPIETPLKGLEGEHLVHSLKWS
ncbi:adenylate/guanylate cyclase domain-containing protein [Marimonas sp. MJW-29]|uniref:Adenylate/guanylate cyclase domain-containing protein n=1 Tax=Sulfitobacter sediminis TaxID=3234186 RepID=A0ABV3RIR6_9RHOB